MATSYSSSLENVEDPFSLFSTGDDLAAFTAFKALSLENLVRTRFKNSDYVPLNSRKSVYSVSHNGSEAVVKYIPYTTFGHTEMFYTRTFSGGLGPVLQQFTCLDSCMEMVLEKADTDLSKRRIINQDHLLAVARDVAFLCYELELSGLGHYDIKPENVLCFVQEDDREVLRLADFGFTMPRKRFYDHYSGFPIGTPGYIPPEEYLDDVDDIVPPYAALPSSLQGHQDIFAYGALLYHLLKGEQALPLLSPPERKQLMLSGEYSQYFLNIHLQKTSPEVQEIIYCCTNPDPRTRPDSFGDILSILGDP